MMELSGTIIQPLAGLLRWPFPLPRGRPSSFYVGIVSRLQRRGMRLP